MSIEVDISDLSLYANDNLAKLLSIRDRYLISYGGRDSGKSYNAAQKIVSDLMDEPYCLVVLLRKVFADIRDSQFRTIIDVIHDWGLEDYFKYTYNPLTIKCLENENKVIARGLDKPTKLKSIKDPSIVWIEEADEISFEAFKSINLSIRSNIKNSLLQMILSFNAENINSWLNKYFFPPAVTYQKKDGMFDFIKSTKNSTTILHSCYINNRYCGDSNRELYESIKNIDKKYYDISLLGIWGQQDDSLIFRNVKYPNKFPEENDRTHYGLFLDWGFTNDPTAIGECCISHGEIYARELCYKKGLVNTTEIKERPSIEKELIRSGITTEEIFADSAEPKSIEELKLKRYNIRGVEKGKDSVESGINNLKAYPINIVNSPNFKKEFENYRYVVKKDDITRESIITNKPIDAFNHGIDGMRYWFKGKVSNHKKTIFDVW